MKKITLLLALFVLPLSFSAQPQTNPLTTKQMYEDFDQFYNIVKDFCAQVELRKLVTGYDVLAEIQSQRKKIEEVKSFSEFIGLLEGSTHLLLDIHRGMIESNNNPWIFFRRGQETIDTSAINAVYKSYLQTQKNSGGLLMTSYHDGKYYNFGNYEFTHKRTREKIKLSDFQVVEYNGVPIEDHVKSVLTTNRRFGWDSKHRKYYVKNLILWHDDCFTAEDNGKRYSICMDSMNKSISGGFSPKELDSIVSTCAPCDQKQKDDRWNVIYFEDLKVLYIHMSQMFPQEQEPEFLQTVKEVGRNKPLEKVIIDVRDNRGGGDAIWQALLSAIVGDTLIENKIGGFNYNKNMENVLKNNYVNLVDDINEYEVEDIAFLNHKKMFVLKDKTTMVPDSNSLRYNGDIYIFQNEESYSSAMSFAAFAWQYPQLISAGVPSGDIAGFGIGPTVFQLSHSKYTFRMEIEIDLSVDPQKPETYFHDTPEIVVYPTLEEQIFRYKVTPKNIYTECFLRNYDSLFQKIVGK